MTPSDHRRLAEQLRIERQKIVIRGGPLSLNLAAMEGFNAAVDIVINALVKDNGKFDLGAFVATVRRDGIERSG